MLVGHHSSASSTVAKGSTAGRVGGGVSTNPSSHHFSSTCGTWRCSPGRGGFFNPTSMVVALAWGGGGRACAASVCSDTPHVSALPRTLISDSLLQLLVTPDLTYHIILLSLLILFFETLISPSMLHYRNRHRYSTTIIQSGSILSRNQDSSPPSPPAAAAVRRSRGLFSTMKPQVGSLVSEL